MSGDQTEEFTYKEIQALKRHVRDETIEECARVVLSYESPAFNPGDIADAIRALKGRP